MHFWYIKNLRTGATGGRRADTFGAACAALGWDYRDCQVTRVTN
jgi:hypothetical protein